MFYKEHLTANASADYGMETENTKGSVLIVEDDMLLSMVEERLVQNLGYQVVGKAETGKDAVGKASELNPDIIIMDISLKGDLDGIETMQEIRKDSNVPVIYLSGSKDRYYYERAKKTNFTDYLTKPITSGDLKGPLSNALNKKGTTHSENPPHSQQDQYNQTA